MTIKDFEAQLEDTRASLILDIIGYKIQKAFEISSIPAMLVEFELIITEYKNETEYIKSNLLWLIDERINKINIENMTYLTEIDNRLIDAFVNKYYED